MTREINKITKTIIGISGKLIVYALVILLLVEGMMRGYAFGHSIFYATPMEAAPGRDFSVTIPEDQEPKETVATLKDMGLIANELAVRIQMWFYDYEIYPGTYKLNTSMTSKEILQLLNEKPAASEESGGEAEAADGENGGSADSDTGSAGEEAAEAVGNTETGADMDGGTVGAEDEDEAGSEIRIE